MRTALRLFTAPLVMLVSAGGAGADHTSRWDVQELLAVDRAEADYFGYSVAAGPDFVVIGTYGDDDNGFGSGSVWVYRFDGTEWVEDQKLAASDGAISERFGFAVAASGDTIVVGAPKDGDRGVDSGSIYVFRYGPGGWLEEQKLTASDGAAGDQLGCSVAVSGNLLTAGADGADDQGDGSGAAYVFRHDGTSWVEEQKLTPGGGAAHDGFGVSVSISGDAVLVGAPGDDDDGALSGSAYVFRHDGVLWTEELKLAGDDLHAGSRFGTSVSISGDHAVVGAPGDDEVGQSEGAAYVFHHDGAGWDEAQKLIPIWDRVESPAGIFGHSVSVSGNALVVGAYGDDFDGALSQETGSAYVFRHDGLQWFREDKFWNPREGSGDFFGFSVSVSGNVVVAGAYSANTSGDDAGVAFTYRRRDNQPPVAVAGVDLEVECTSPVGAIVRLDGSGSTDPDSTPGTNDDIVRFEWFEDLGQPSVVFLGEGEVLDIPLSPGGHLITLKVTDAAGESDIDDVLKSVVDTTPPEIDVGVDPATLWPPNHRLVEVAAQVSATDRCGTPEVRLSYVTSSEPDNAPGSGDGNTDNDVQGADLGTADYGFLLRAEREGGGDGRTYAVGYAATDESGNEASAESLARVPHSRGGKTDPVEQVVDTNESGTVIRWNEVPDAAHYNVVRGRLDRITETPTSIDLGPVRCVEAGSLDDSTEGWEDPETPGTGETFFYLVEYDDGSRSSYGTETASKPRIPATGDCQ